MLIPFEAKDVDYVLEFGATYIRFYKEHQLLMNGASVYEVTTPYLEDEVESIQYIQNGDYLYIFHKNHPIKTLAMYGETDWRLEDFELKSGPWDYMNTTENALSVSAATGDITITSNSALFTQNDVGRLIRITCVDSQKTAWQAEKSGITNEQILYSDGKYYQAQSAGTTGTVKPVHTEGTVSDGGLLFTYYHSGYGTAKITQVTSATQVSATVIDRFPDELISNGSKYWELGLIHKGMEYPVCGTFYRGRFCFMFNNNGIPTICLSNSDDYDNFADKEHGEVLATNAITMPITSTKRNDCSWLVSADVLFIGTSSAEFYLDSASSAEALAPDNVKIQQISSVGSLPITPVKIGSHTLFVTRTGTSVRDIIYSFNTDSYDPIELSLYGRHLLSSGIKGMSYQEYPDKIIWFTVNDGRLIGMTFSAEQQVNALHQHYFNGDVENITTIHNYENSLDELWLMVNRAADGITYPCIEWVDNGYPAVYPEEIINIVDMEEKEVEEALYMKNNSFYVDSGDIFYRDPYSGINGVVSCLSSNFWGKTATLFDEHKTSVQITKEITEADNTLHYETKLYRNNNVSYSAQIPVESINGASYTVGFSSSLSGCYVIVYQFTNLLSGGRLAKVLYEGFIGSSNLTFALNIGAGQTATSVKINIAKDVPNEDIEIEGFERLEGKEVVVMVDGAEQPRQIVTGGKVLVKNTAKNITIGLPFESQYIPQNIYIQANNGAGVGDVQRIDHVTLMLWRSMLGKVGKNTKTLQDIYYRGTDEPMGKSSPLYTGNKEIPVNMSTTSIKEKGATVLIYNDSVFPMNILAIAPHFTTSGNGK